MYFKMQEIKVIPTAIQFSESLSNQMRYVHKSGLEL